MSASDRPALVVTAIPEELAPILRRLRDFSATRVGGRKLFRSEVCSRRLLLAATGDGRRVAERVAREHCEELRPTALIGLGVAGALTPSLRLFELVASAHLANGSAATPAADASLLSLATSRGARPGTLVTVSAPVVSASDKKSLAAGLAQADQPAAVDMESAGWARGAAAAGVPFVVVRAIADAAEEGLPEYLRDCVGPDGGLRRAAVLRRALARPASFSALLRMKRRVGQCGERLAVFLTDFFV